MKTVRARRHIKRMRGGANAHLMLADQGGRDAYYVVKFRDNPQHRRILTNEAVCHELLDYLGLPTPPCRLVEVGAELIENTPELTMEFGRRTERCKPGLHFGSQFPVDPVRQAVYDYVPLSLLRQVVNVDCLLGMAVFDKWVSNANGRQAVFFRDRAKEWLPEHGADGPDGRPIGPRSLVYVANVIDNGFAFDAQRWEFSDRPEQGLYARHEVYDKVSGYDSFEPYLSRIVDLPVEVMDKALESPAAEWFEDDFDEFEAMLETLYERRKRAPELLRKGKQAERDPFPKWLLAEAAGGAR